MKDIDKQLNKLMMEYELSTSSRSEFEILCKLEELIDKEKRKMYMSEKEGKSYFLLANNIMMSDIADFLDTYRKLNRTPGYDKYVIRTNYNSLSNKTVHLYMDIFYRNKLKTNGLNTKINNFPQYTLFSIIGLDISDKQFKSSKKQLLKDEYDKFMYLREANSSYFLPFITDLINGLNNVEEI